MFVKHKHQLKYIPCMTEVMHQQHIRYMITVPNMNTINTFFSDIHNKHKLKFNKQPMVPDPRKTIGPDQIPTCILKECVNEIALPTIYFQSNNANRRNT